MKLINTDYIILHEISLKSSLGGNDIYISNNDLNSQHVIHLLSILDVKKMIPVKEGIYSIININPHSTDTPDELKYKTLLNKEYSFCVNNTTNIVKMASNIYNKQMKTGKIKKFCCDFNLLEKISDEYIAL